MNPIFPTLETERLILRPLAADDLEFVFRHFSDPQVGRYLLDDEPVTTRTQAQAILDFYLPPDDKPYNRWVLTRRSDGEPLGTCGFHKWRKPHHCAEIGYDLTPAGWGQGYMTEALRAVLQHGFGPMDLNRVEALIHPGNQASLRLAERLGFRREGLLRQCICQAGVYYDHWLLARLKADAEQ